VTAGWLVSIVTAERLTSCVTAQRLTSCDRGVVDGASDGERL